MEVWRMFFVLIVYGFSCNNSCAESCSPFKHTINWFLKKRLDTNLCQIFNKVREKTVMVSLQNCKSCVCIKYLTLVRPRKLIPWFLPFYTRCKMHRTPVLLKNYSFYNFLNRSNFVFVCFFSKKLFNLKKCLCHVFVYAMALTRTVRLTCPRICWSFS